MKIVVAAKACPGRQTVTHKAAPSYSTLPRGERAAIEIKERFAAEEAASRFLFAEENRRARLRI